MLVTMNTQWTIHVQAKDLSKALHKIIECP